MRHRLHVTSLACANRAAMQTTTQFIQPGAASHTSRTTGSRLPAFVLPWMSELPAQLQALAPDSFAGSGRRAAVCGGPIHRPPAGSPHMTSHRRTRRVLAVIVAALCVALSVSASALAAAPAGDSKADYQGTAAAPLVGDTAPVFGSPFAPAAGRGDTPPDHPGASGAQKYDAPATTQVVRPERTVVRDVNAAVPTILAGLALLVALGGTGFVLVRTRSLRRGAVGH